MDSDRAFRQQLISHRSLVIIGSLEKTVSSLVGQQVPTELPPSLRVRQQEDTVRVAAQLPGINYISPLKNVPLRSFLDKLSGLPDVLSSKHSSPAAKRLALSILFAVFVVEPVGDPWGGSK